jgi:hypothetical protein
MLADKIDLVALEPPQPARGDTPYRFRALFRWSPVPPTGAGLFRF